MSKQLDFLISAFAAHQHPIVVVELHALRWMGANPVVDDTLHLLTRPADTKFIVADILSSDLWRLHDQKPGLEYLLPGDYEALTCLFTVDGSSQLTLWPETAYGGLSVDGPLIQVPDFAALNAVLAEAEMSPPAMEVSGGGWAPKLLRSDERRWPKSDAANTPITTAVMWQEVKIFVPTVANMLSAFAARERKIKAPSLGPRYYIGLLIRYLFLEKPEQRSKLKAQMNEENWTYLCNILDTYVRTDKRTGAMMRGGKPVVWEKA